MSLACSVAITVFTLHSEHVRIAILSGFQLVWSSELMVNLTFYIVVAMRDCEIWQFPVWSSFTYYKSTRKKERNMKEKFHFSMVNKVSCTKKEYTLFEIWIQKRNKEYVLSKNVLSFCVSGWIKAVRMIIANIVKEIEKNTM